MQTSDFAVLAFALAVPVLVVAGCLDASTCLRNSDCPAVDVCSVGACILAPPDTPLEGGTDDGGTDDGATAKDSATPTDGGGGGDGTTDAGADGTTGDAAKGDASDASDASDANDGNDTADATGE